MLPDRCSPGISSRLSPCPVCVDDGVDGFPELGNAEVGADGHIAVEPDRGFSSVRSRVLRIERME